MELWQQVEGTPHLQGDCHWDLLKMAVCPQHQGKGLGKLVLQWIIDTLTEKTRKWSTAASTPSSSSFSQHPVGRLVLETSSKLKAAVAMYKGQGFQTTHQRDLTARYDGMEQEAKEDGTTSSDSAPPTTGGVGERTSDSFPGPYALADVIMELKLCP